MARKLERQQAIRGLVEGNAIASQEELRVLMERVGWGVTQATLSRDLRELGIIRAPMAEGSRYMLPERFGEEAKPHLDVLLPQLFSHIDGVGELIVLHTRPGGAQPIAEAIDSQTWPEKLGTLAGENTVLIVCRSAADRMALTKRLVGLAARNRV